MQDERRGRALPRRDVVLVVPPTHEEEVPTWAGALDGVAVHVRQAPDKWSGVVELTRERPDLLDGDGSVWVPDPGTTCSPQTVEVLFALHEELHLDLSHPALHDDGRAAHPQTRPHAGFSLRWVDHVEATAPLFSRRALRRVLPVLGGHPAGLPHAWCVLLGGASTSTAVLDCAVVSVPGTAPAVPQHAATSLAAAHGVPVPREPRLRGGLDEALGRLPLAEAIARATVQADRSLLTGCPGAVRYAEALRTDLVLATGKG